jgi:hypothetical protein
MIAENAKKKYHYISFKHINPGIQRGVFFPYTGLFGLYFFPDAALAYANRCCRYAGNDCDIGNREAQLYQAACQ